MFTGKNVKKFVIVFLIISLIYANLSTTILGVISYAQENTEVTKPKREEENKPFKVEISDFTKNEMSEKETEYQEKITLTPNKEKSFEKEMCIRDRHNSNKCRKKRRRRSKYASSLSRWCCWLCYI